MMNTITSSSSSTFLLTFTSTTTNSPSPSSNITKTNSHPSRTIFCRTQKPSKNHLPFILHDALQSSGIDITHAKVAREGYVNEIEWLSEVERDSSICVNRKIDLARTVLFIGAEDDALVSHSSVPLPVSSFLERLDDLSMGFCSYYGSSLKASPEDFLGNLEKFCLVIRTGGIVDVLKTLCKKYEGLSLYVLIWLENAVDDSLLLKGFQRAGTNLPESRALYLHSVLTHRSGSAVMLSLIYSEILKMLRLWGLLKFDVEIYCPHDQVSLPKGYHKLKSKDSDQPHILTTQSLLVQILKNLKEAFWPFRYDPSRSLFLRAASAAKCISGPNTVEETAVVLSVPSAKAAQHRLERGVWTSVCLGDMRRALSASERLILLDYDLDELRDYSILLYHCGFYEESSHYLSQYRNSMISSLKRKRSSSKLKRLEDDAVEELKTRLNLILMEDSQTRPSNFRNSLENHSEPW
ncbi:hypothetical protein IFM89_013903 [Coptis chinensis]|uniref:Protein SirB1 N-terminal domain-containing protein n=1 Tax=Coptis chinensis TaxID=261450 RepID=A0A835HAP4_9MAGN|nr:hypothetical protein IFM89_013903 [Coptis chinensis]